MKKALIILNSILLILLFAGCPSSPEKLIVLTPQELCEHMNKNYEGDFVLIDANIEDDEFKRINTAYMTCSLFPGEIVRARQGYTNYLHFGWRDAGLYTNYDYIYYKKAIEEKAAGYAQNWFEKYNYKIVNATIPINVMNSEKKYESLAQYLQEYVSIDFYIVIDAHNEAVKSEALTKAESVKHELENTQEPALNFYFFLYQDTGFDSLTDEEIIKEYRFTDSI